MSKRAHTETVRMNDYVGPGRFARVTWDGVCNHGRGHTLGLLTRTCVRCGRRPIFIVPEAKKA